MRLDETLNAASGVWFEGEPVDRLETPFQLIEVFDTPELGKLMRIAGANMVSEKDEFLYHENLVHPAAICHPAPRRVLIVGGGDGGTAREIFRHPSVERVVLAELDAGVVDMARKHFPGVHGGALDDARLELRIGDGMAFVRDTAERFDLIYLDLTDPVGPAEALYTQGFYADCRRALAPGGALVLHAGSPFSHRERVHSTLQALRAVFAIATPYFVHIPMYGALWGFAVAGIGVDLQADEIDTRLTVRRIAGLGYFCGATHHSMQVLPPYLDGLRG